MERIDYLPLGSVVYLKSGNKKLMIVARGLITNSGNKQMFFDYGGVMYPEGVQDDQMAYFQHDAITKVVFEGYKDMDDEATVDKINMFVEQHPEIVKGNVEDLIK